ncbi:hypothetical protein ACI6Q2_05700 [Chitinophagaceae bacterium LWZ2-11]
MRKNILLILLTGITLSSCATNKRLGCPSTSGSTGGSEKMKYPYTR